MRALDGTHRADDTCPASQTWQPREWVVRNEHQSSPWCVNTQPWAPQSSHRCPALPPVNLSCSFDFFSLPRVHLVPPAITDCSFTWHPGQPCHETGPVHSELNIPFMRKVQAKRETIAAEFNKLHTLLRAEEQLLLQRLAEDERATLQRLQENVTKLSQQSASLQRLIAEIEEKCQQPAAQLLKDVTSMLSRSENMKLQAPEVVCTDLRNGYKMCLDLREALNRFAMDVTLDPDTAHPKLILSAGRKSVRRGTTRQDLPDNPERFDTCPSVLGAEGFAGGRRYWEVEVGDKTGWTLGVCKESVRRKGKVAASPKNGYWAVVLREEGYKALTCPGTFLPVSTRPSRVGIFLDYEAGEVSFYNVTDRSHLFTFACTFSGTLRPYFKPARKAAPLTICLVPAQAGGNRHVAS
ncbi:E3 ubiquitin-protein ligase TRIM11-like isoform X2 [Pelodiscus sinensis]|uniref:E3 ubiquitin-protein ligase TRIM11-like isoform X2 n=1 Tax=Pelodiscus sinensis TaxID=13735 RepID=UPI003F6CB8F2